MSTTERSASEKGSRAEQKKQARATSISPVEPIEVVNRQRGHSIDRDGARRLARAVLDAIGEQEATLSIVFLRDKRMRQLNLSYRGIDKPTDVLSFAYHENGEDGDPEEEGPRGHLGDLVISVETAERYARELGIDFELEIEHLVIHGALHLAGYDHETDNGEMSRLEKRLRRRLLAPRDGAPPTQRR